MQLVCMAFAIVIVLGIRLAWAVQVAVWKLTFHVLRGFCKLAWWLMRLVGRGFACLFRWVRGRVAERRAAALPAAGGMVPGMGTETATPALRV